VCGTINEHENSFASSCYHCGKYFAPFYFFEEGDLKGVKDDGLHVTLWKMQEGYHPLWGFSTYWEEN
jgi:hypothetical protein